MIVFLPGLSIHSCQRLENGAWQLVKCHCKNGLVFDPDIEVCTWPSGDCIGLSQLKRFVEAVVWIQENATDDPDICNA